MLPHIRNGKNFCSHQNHRPRDLGLGGRPLLTEVQEGSTTFRDMPWARGIEVKARGHIGLGVLGGTNGGKKNKKHPRIFQKRKQDMEKHGGFNVTIKFGQICCDSLIMAI